MPLVRFTNGPRRGLVENIRRMPVMVSWMPPWLAPSWYTAFDTPTPERSLTYQLCYVQTDVYRNPLYGTADEIRASLDPYSAETYYAQLRSNEALRWLEMELHPARGITGARRTAALNILADRRRAGGSTIVFEDQLRRDAYEEVARLYNEIAAVETIVATPRVLVNATEGVVRLDTAAGLMEFNENGNVIAVNMEATVPRTPAPVPTPPPPRTPDQIMACAEENGIHVRHYLGRGTMEVRRGLTTFGIANTVAEVERMLMTALSVTPDEITAFRKHVRGLLGRWAVDMVGTGVRSPSPSPAPRSLEGLSPSRLDSPAGIAEWAERARRSEPLFGVDLGGSDDGGRAGDAPAQSVSPEGRRLRNRDANPVVGATHQPSAVAVSTVRGRVMPSDWMLPGPDSPLWQEANPGAVLSSMTDTEWLHHFTRAARIVAVAEAQRELRNLTGLFGPGSPSYRTVYVTSGDRQEGCGCSSCTASRESGVLADLNERISARPYRGLTTICLTDPDSVRDFTDRCLIP